MRVAILQSAKDDLRDGFLFYERQGGSYLGNYFLASLQSDMSSLALYAGIHNKRFGFHRALSRRFPYSIFMTSRTVKRASMAYWTTAAIQIGYITTFKSRKTYTDSSYAATLPPELQG